MSIELDVQTLEPGGLVDLFTLDGTAVGAPTLRFHQYTKQGNITWQALAFTPWPIRGEGFARTGDAQPNPMLAVGNVNGYISNLCLAYDSFIGATLIRQRTLAKYLDAVNFPDGNPTANPNEQMPPEIWYVERKATEDNVQVQFELSSGFDFNGMQLPGRQIVANKCVWLTIGGYRGPYCNYSGPPVAMADGTPTSDPLLDRCGGCVSDCKARFGADNPLNYGSFAAADLVR